MEKPKSDGGTENVEHDHISSLPDDVLTHILSFLSTKEAVSTCVMSKRWINTWTTVPVLVFDFDEFLSDNLDGHPVGERERRKCVARFEQFVHGVLNNHESTNLDIVCYMRQMQKSETFVPMEWLDRVALLMPRVINIYISQANYKRGNYNINLPDSVFSSAKLQHLKMGFYTNKSTIIRPASINLPLLKVLGLSGVELHNNFTQKLFMGCPSLEMLDLCCCELYFSSISSNALKELTIQHCHQFEHMQISCPVLVTLYICSHFQRGGVGISLKKAINLVNATIILFWWRRSNGGHDDVPVLDIFSGLSSTTELGLYIESDLKEPVDKDVSNYRNFKNLKKLLIGMSDTSYDFYLIACLLKCSPNLNELNFLVSVNRGYIQEKPRQEILGDAFFQHEYLENVKIKFSHMLPSECVENLIKTLDKYVKKIENLIITYD